MNKNELVAAIAKNADVSKKDAEKCLAAFVEAVTDALKAGDADTLKELLREGRERKEEIDTEWKR